MFCTERIRREQRTVLKHLKFQPQYYDPEKILHTLASAMLVRILVLLPRKLSLGSSTSLDKDTGGLGEGEASVSCRAKIDPKWNCPTNFTKRGNSPLSLLVAFRAYRRASATLRNCPFWPQTFRICGATSNVHALFYVNFHQSKG